MPSLPDFTVPAAVQPRPQDYGFDLDRALDAVVGLHAIVPPDAFTAETLGTERGGNGVVIGDGLVLTIGYLVMEAETVWLHPNDGRVVEGHVLGVDPETGRCGCRRCGLATHSPHDSRLPRSARR